MRESTVAHACNSRHDSRLPEAEVYLGYIPRSYLEKSNSRKYKGKERAEKKEKGGEKPDHLWNQIPKKKLNK